MFSEKEARWSSNSGELCDMIEVLSVASLVFFRADSTIASTAAYFRWANTSDLSVLISCSAASCVAACFITSDIGFCASRSALALPSFCASRHSAADISGWPVTRAIALYCARSRWFWVSRPAREPSVMPAPIAAPAVNELATASQSTS